VSHGLRAFREEIAAYLRTAAACHCDAAQVMVVSGSQQALHIAARVLLEPTERGLGGGTGLSRRARRCCGLAGARLLPVPVDEEGLDVRTGIARHGRRPRACTSPRRISTRWA
jgi:GntR family transcriptional regulator/MocR family aminotransferase